MLSLIRKILNKTSIHLVLIFIFSIAIFAKVFLTQGYLLFADSVPFTLNFNSFNHIANYIYTEKCLGLLPNPVYILGYFFVHKIFFLLNIFFSQETLTVLSVFFPFLILNYAVYFSFFILIKNKTHSFILTLLYVFSMVTFDMLFTGGITAWSNIGGFIFLASFIAYLKTQHNKYLILLIFSSLFGVMNLAFFYCIILACIFYFLIFLILNTTKNNLPHIYHIILKLFITIIFIVLINAFWILPCLLAKSDIPDTYKTDDTLLISRSKVATPLNNFQFGNVYRKEPVFSEPYEQYNTKMYMVAFFSFLILSLFQITSKLNKNKNILILFAVFLLLFSFSLGKGFIFWDLFSKIPGWFFLRDPLRFLYLLFFIFLILFGYTIARVKNKLIYIFIFIYILFNMYIFIKSDIWGFYSKNPLPEDYIKVQDYLSQKENSDKTVLVLPEFPWYPRYSWMKNNFYLPVITENLLDNPLVLSFIKRGGVPEYFNKFYDQKIYPAEYASYLGKAGIKFILLHNDDIDVKKSIILDNINGIKKIINGSNLNLYEIDDTFYYPSLFSNNKLSFKKINPTKYAIKINISEQTGLVFNQPYNQNWKLFLRNNNSIYDCKKNYQITNTKECDNKNVFFEGEELKYLYLNPLFENTHKVEFNYANMWTINPEYIKQNFPKEYYKENPDGSIDIELTLYFKPQSYFYLGLIISGMTLLGCLGYLGYDRRKRKNKRKLVEVTKSVSYGFRQ